MFNKKLKEEIAELKKELDAKTEFCRFIEYDLGECKRSYREQLKDRDKRIEFIRNKIFDCRKSDINNIYDIMLLQKKFDDAVNARKIEIEAQLAKDSYYEQKSYLEGTFGDVHELLINAINRSSVHREEKVTVEEKPVTTNTLRGIELGMPIFNDFMSEKDVKTMRKNLRQHGI